MTTFTVYRSDEPEPVMTLDADEPHQALTVARLRLDGHPAATTSPQVQPYEGLMGMGSYLVEVKTDRRRQRLVCGELWTSLG